MCTRTSCLTAARKDAYSQVDQRGTSRLQTAILAASRHASDAHFILVAMGFELNTTAREAAVRHLPWKTSTMHPTSRHSGISSRCVRKSKAKYAQKRYGTALQCRSGRVCVAIALLSRAPTNYSPSFTNKVIRNAEHHLCNMDEHTYFHAWDP